MLDRYEAILTKIINDEIERERDGLADGAATDYADYKRRIGIIEGLVKALGFMEMAHTDTFKD